MKGEGISTVAAAITRKQPAESYCLVVKTGVTLVTFDFQGFPKVGDKQPRGKKYMSFQDLKKTHLLIFCIPMTSREQEFLYTPHAETLKLLSEMDEKIFDNTAIVLTHANETPQQDYQNELEQWEREIRKVLSMHIHLDEKTAMKVPIIPVGDYRPTIDLADGQQYHWLSELLLQIIPIMKIAGLPSLLTLNKQRTKKQSSEYHDLEQAKEQIIEAQCDMFSRMGLRDYKSLHGEAIGLILGENEDF